MGVQDTKIVSTAGVAKRFLSTMIAAVIDRTAVTIRVTQVPFSFVLTSVQLYCASVTSTVTMLVGIVRPGRAIQAVTMAVATTTTKFQVTSALTAVMPTHAVRALPTVVAFGATDNIAFSSAFTINAALTAGIWWGAVRVQMDSAGAVTTKVKSTDQAYADEAGALAACPQPDAGFFNLGTITIPVATGAKFTAQTDSLTDAAHVGTVKYNGVAAGFVNSCSADASFIAATLVRGTTVAFNTRAVAQPGGLIVVQETTSHTGAVVDGVLDVGYRVWPLDGEVAPSGT